MKIKPEHYAVLKQAVDSVLERVTNIRSEYQAKGLSDKRYRWDLLYATKIKIGDGRGMSGLPLYEYMDDTHIDTALRAITGTK